MGKCRGNFTVCMFTIDSFNTTHHTLPHCATPVDVHTLVLQLTSDTTSDLSVTHHEVKYQMV